MREEVYTFRVNEIFTIFMNDDYFQNFFKMFFWLKKWSYRYSRNVLTKRMFLQTKLPLGRIYLGKKTCILIYPWCFELTVLHTSFWWTGCDHSLCWSIESEKGHVLLLHLYRLFYIHLEPVHRAVVCVERFTVRGLCRETHISCSNRTYQLNVDLP